MEWANKSVLIIQIVTFYKLSVQIKSASELQLTLISMLGGRMDECLLHILLQIENNIVSAHFHLEVDFP